MRLYGRRLLKPSSLDVEYVLWQMLQLCVEPKRVYRTTTFHSRVKHQWARDDPAIVVVLAYMLAVAGVAWCLAFGQGALETLSLLLYVLLFDFVALGSAIASAGWWVSNNYLRDDALREHVWVAAADAKEEHVEWRYAFDVHTNAFVPTFLLLYVVQYLLLPLLLRGGVLAALLSDTLYAAAFTIYWYLTFLGYSELPFLRGAVTSCTRWFPSSARMCSRCCCLNATEIVVGCTLDRSRVVADALSTHARSTLHRDVVVITANSVHERACDSRRR